MPLAEPPPKENRFGKPLELKQVHWGPAETQLRSRRSAEQPQAHLYWRFFDGMIDPDSGRYLSEDYAFCRGWHDEGGEAWVDLNCKLIHLG